MDLILIYFSIKYKGYFHDIYNALKNKEYVPKKEIEKIQLLIDNGELHAITIIDDDYPESLKLINNPPFVLFYKGNKKILQEEIIILTGEFKNEMIEHFTTNSLMEISKKHALITNYVKGFDEMVVDNLIKEQKKVIFVSPNGIINPYFAKNIDISQVNENVLIISEYPANSNINKRRLLERNRITIGLAKSLIIASSNKVGMINNLVSVALEQGKDIYCFPGLQSQDDGNNNLIQDGAKMITSIKELR